MAIKTEGQTPTIEFPVVLGKSRFYDENGQLIDAGQTFHGLGRHVDRVSGPLVLGRDASKIREMANIPEYPMGIGKGGE